jgi:hypothetical protein
MIGALMAHPLLERGELKLLHLPNDPWHDDTVHLQHQSRETFRRMVSEGLLGAYREIRFLSDYRRTKDAESVKANILRQVQVYAPDIIYWHHIGGFPVDQAFFDALRATAGDALLVGHEGDVYGGPKPAEASLRLLLKNADLIFSVSLGQQAKLFRNLGAKDLRYLPHVYDTVRFGHAWDFPSERSFAVSMLANNWRGWRPWKHMPGARKRCELARRLDRAFGGAFALYGKGWKLTSAQGCVPFDEQEAAIRKSWVSANWDHFDDYEYYFSDRLPITMAAGVVHVTNYHPGYEDIFRDCPGVYFAHTVDEAVAKVDWLLCKSKAQLAVEGRGAQEWSKQNLEAYVVFRRSIEQCAEKIAMMRASRVAAAK